MTLSEYINLKRGNAKELAERLTASGYKVSPSYLSQMASGKSPISPEMCVQIEMHTEGQVSRRCLKPNWLSIWPELADRRRVMDKQL